MPDDKNTKDQKSEVKDPAVAKAAMCEQKPEEPAVTPITEENEPVAEPVVNPDATSDAAGSGFKTQVSEGTQKVAEASKKAAEVTGEVLSSSYKKVKDYDPKTSIHILDRFLNWIRKVCPPETFDKIADWCAKYGHAGIVAAQVLVVLFFIVKAFKTQSIGEGLGVLIHGIGVALLLVILQYTADKFLHAGKRFIESTPSRLSSSAFLDCSALLLEISGLLIFLGMATEGWVNALLGLAIWSLLEAIALTAMHPEMVNVSIEEDVKAGEEAIGILSFFAKSVLKIVPIAYGVGAIVGAIALVLAGFSLLKGNPADAGNDAIALIIVFACLPFVSYILFMVYHLFIDILQSILSVPRKLDKMK
jgi:hypothetical protein